MHRDDMSAHHSDDEGPVGKEKKSFKIFVGGLAADVTEDQLLDYFSYFGSVSKCKAKKWKNDKSKCKGFAIVVADNQETYDSILESSHSLNGRTIECKRAITNKNELIKHNQMVVSQKIFVTGLSPQTTDQDLKNFFSRFGEVKMAYVVKNNSTHKKSRIGFVSFAKKEQKDKVLSSKSYKWNENRVFVSDYHTKSELVYGDKDKDSRDMNTTNRSQNKGSPHKRQHSKTDEMMIQSFTPPGERNNFVEVNSYEAGGSHLRRGNDRGDYQANIGIDTGEDEPSIKEGMQQNAPSNQVPIASNQEEYYQDYNYGINSDQYLYGNSYQRDELQNQNYEPNYAPHYSSTYGGIDDQDGREQRGPGPLSPTSSGNYDYHQNFSYKVEPSPQDNSKNYDPFGNYPSQPTRYNRYPNFQIDPNIQTQPQVSPPAYLAYPGQEADQGQPNPSKHTNWFQQLKSPDGAYHPFSLGRTLKGGLQNQKPKTTSNEHRREPAWSLHSDSPSGPLSSSLDSAIPQNYRIGALRRPQKKGRKQGNRLKIVENGGYFTRQ